MPMLIGQPIGQNGILRSSIYLRKNAENAYERHHLFNGIDRKKTAKDETVEETGTFQKLGAGQVKQVAVPVGKTPEETKEMWQGVRREAISTPNPTTADYQLVAKASSNIRKVEAQMALHQQAETKVDVAAKEDGLIKSASASIPAERDRESIVRQRDYEQAIASYSFHMQMKKYGFEIKSPSFYRIA